MSRIATAARVSYEFGFAALAAAALLVQFVHGAIAGDGLTLRYVALFLSYFTVLSNMLVVLVLYADARMAMRGTAASHPFERLRAFATFCIIATGVVYSATLRGVDSSDQLANILPWTNAIFHQAIPIAVAVGWALFPAKERVQWDSIAYWIAIAIAYVLCIELLGAFSGAYPYFFLNPMKFGGYAGVATATLGLIPFFAMFGVLVVVLNRFRVSARKANA